MTKWLYALSGCIIGFLVKKKVDECTTQDPIKDWPKGLDFDDTTDNYTPPD